MANPYKNAPSAKLADFIPADKFWTILSQQRHIEGGVSEIPVEIHTKKPFADTLSFNIEWDGIVYGFVRGRNEISEKLSGFDVKKITVSDWDDKFQLLFEGEKETDEIPFFVTGEEVRELLENCRRVPEQNVPKRK